MSLKIFRAKKTLTRLVHFFKSLRKNAKENIGAMNMADLGFVIFMFIFCQKTVSNIPLFASYTSSAISRWSI